MEFVSKNVSETDDFAEKFVDELGVDTNTVGLYGDLGSGKTTFVKAVAKKLGISNTVTSPTFVIEKIYALENSVYEHLIHIDAYRLESGKELLGLGWEEISNNTKNLIFIEWPEKVKDILPKNIKKIEFTFIDENTRKIEVM